MNNHSPKLSTHNLSFGYKNKLILDNISLEIPTGKISALIGPNGSGKSTLLKVLCGLLKPNNGEVLLENQPINHYKSKQLAQSIAFLPQRSSIPDNYRVTDLLNAGRFPYQSLIKKISKEDVRVIKWALDITQMHDYKDYFINELSGGLQQRAWLAMILTQQTPIIILDEPSTYLDIKHQLQLLQLVKTLNIDHKKTIIWVLHDLAHAAQTSDYLFVLNSGQLVAQGDVESIRQSGVLNRTFDVKLAPEYFNKHVELL